jgi:hypothetical protein
VFPANDPIVTNQFVGFSDSGEVQVAVVGVAIQTLVRQFEQLTIDDRNNVLAFLANPLVNFSQFSFTYTDAIGVAHTVRYLEQQWSMPAETESVFSWNVIFTKVL